MGFNKQEPMRDGGRRLGHMGQWGIKESETSKGDVQAEGWQKGGLTGNLLEPQDVWGGLTTGVGEARNILQVLEGTTRVTPLT